MSKMKHLLRKLHIGGGSGDDFADHHGLQTATARSPANVSPTPQTAAFPPPTPSFSTLATSSSGVESTVDTSVDFSFFEEEFQMQLALAISVSDPETREDAETAQIKAAKQRSLGFSPSDAVVEYLSVRYWSNNVVNYDEKVMDGFYDVYGVSSNSSTQGKMPSLADLEAITVSENVNCEVILVNRAIDTELQKLEEKVIGLLLNYQAQGAGQVMNGLVQIIADIVVDRMGGPVSNADEMLKSWTSRSRELQNSVNSIVIPIGSLDVGLSRHRALLFKVLGDRINLPCMLIKGSYYTGTDDGAVNLIKVDDGSEYIIDLMGAPGTLIPAEVPSCNLQNFDLDMKNCADISENVKQSIREEVTETACNLERVVAASSSYSEEASSKGIQSKKENKNVGDKKHMERFEYDFGKLLPSLRRSNEGSPSSAEKRSAAKKLQVKDVSKCVISAAKNPDFAQKLHAVLLENGASANLDLFSNINPQYQGEENMLVRSDIDNKNILDGGMQGDQLLLPSNELSLIPFSGPNFFDNVHYDHDQKHTVKRPQTVQPRFSITDHMLPPFFAEKEGSALDYSGINTKILTHDVSEVGSSKLVASFLDADHINQSSLSHVDNPFNGQNEYVHSGNVAQCFRESTADVSSNIEKPKETCMQLIPTANIGQCISCNTSYHEKCTPVLGEVAEWEIPWEDLQVFERIGIGSYGEVFRAEWNSTEVAVKRFMNQDISGDALDQFKCEVEIMLRLRHPNVVLFMGAVTRPPNLSILTEFLPRLI